MIEQYVNAEELKRLVSSLLVFLGIILIAALFAVIVAPGLRNANKPPAPTPVNPVVGEPGWLDPAEFPPQRGKEIPPVDPDTLISSSRELLDIGKELFDRSCAQCHGELGQADGPAAPTMNPKPRNLASPEGWRKGYDLAGIYATLSEGLQGTSMAPFDQYTKKERMALAHYVQSLGTLSGGAGSREAVEALSKELATAGEKTPNRIPVSLATAKLLEEFVAPAPLAVAPDDLSPGGALLKRIVKDPSRASQTLTGHSLWRESVEDLAASIVADAPGNGFSTSAASLSATEWHALHEELLARIGR